MSRDHKIKDADAFRIDDSIDDDLFDSPDAKSHEKSTVPTQDATSSRQGSRYTEGDARDSVLTRELENIRSINKVIENVNESLEKARNNMDTVHRTVQSASTLLNTWTRILAQTEHNQRLLLDPNWRGATQDLEDMEKESMIKQQAAERRAAEEQMRREEAARQAEETERKRATTPRGSRGRARGAGAGRGGVNGQASFTGSETSATRGRSISRAGSGIGRGVAGARGRGRGVG